MTIPAYNTVAAPAHMALRIVFSHYKQYRAREIFENMGSVWSHNHGLIIVYE
jgi:hypothetical protein